MAALHSNINTAPHMFPRHRHKPNSWASSVIPHWLSVLRTHFLFLFTGSWNKILSAESNCKCWVTDSRKLVQVSIRLEAGKKKNLFLYPLEGTHFFLMIQILNKNLNKSYYIHSKILGVLLWPLLIHMHIQHMYMYTTLIQIYSLHHLQRSFPICHKYLHQVREESAVCFLLYHDFSSGPVCYLDSQWKLQTIKHLKDS